MTFELRPYQRQAVNATLQHFRRSNDSAVIVLPTGAGKSLVIAELARLARRRILVLAHVKELVAQNCEKFQSYGRQASVFAAGLEEKQTEHQVVFGSVQSVARNLDAFRDDFSLLIVDECHRLSGQQDSEYHKIVQHLTHRNSELKVLGLTATPYRMDCGWCFQFHQPANETRGDSQSPFRHCIFELSLRYMIDNNYLTPAKLVDAPVQFYDFESLRHNGNSELLDEASIKRLLQGAKRATAQIIEQVIALSSERQGVMIFAATVAHAKEIMGYLPGEQSALIIGDMKARARDSVITAFKAKQIKYLVNVSVLTTGFDAPHVDIIAILRATQSVGLYQQIVGRGLRLSPGKKDCLVLDYAANGYDLFQPEIAGRRPDSDSEIVEIPCPICRHINTFWGKTDDCGQVMEHYGRRCQGIVQNPDNGMSAQCDFRYRFKECDQCGAENDIAARHCHQCQAQMVDPDTFLKKVLQLRDAKVLRCSGMQLQAVQNRQQQPRLKITYFDEDGASLSEHFALQTQAQRKAFYVHFCRHHAKLSGRRFDFNSPEQVLQQQDHFRHPDFVIGRLQGRFWKIKEKIFDYEGRYRRAHEL
ncbi:DEAD/DEAH box helicase [Pseudomaricurvus alkylphenolicus]|uniref:DEAD/DEAH box helicase n=1 Tax=Pseudomaricurvus alkylphenolicus TaxID=1306991 RepID=UPI0014206227|nr:DEAD/DEAH box helicase [Pseudomaricurvus alkylphenolicus]NIB44575.1 DEAD/DEAH box helicase [Pseudomaricurvus alkylphenolicus]